MYNRNKKLLNIAAGVICIVLGLIELICGIISLTNVLILRTEMAESVDPTLIKSSFNFLIAFCSIDIVIGVILMGIGVCNFITPRYYNGRFSSTKPLDIIVLVTASISLIACIVSWIGGAGFATVYIIDIVLLIALMAVKIKAMNLRDMDDEAIYSNNNYANGSAKVPVKTQAVGTNTEEFSCNSTKRMLNVIVGIIFILLGAIEIVCGIISAVNIAKLKSAIDSLVEGAETGLLGLFIFFCILDMLFGIVFVLQGLTSLKKPLDMGGYFKSTKGLDIGILVSSAILFVFVIISLIGGTGIMAIYIIDLILVVGAVAMKIYAMRIEETFYDPKARKKSSSVVETTSSTKPSKSSATSTTSASKSNSNPSMSDKIKELKELKDQGFIDDAQYKTSVENVLNEYTKKN